MSDWIWRPAQESIERTNVWRFMRKQGFSDRETFLAWSREHNEEFWASLVAEVGIEWFTPYDRVLDASRGVEWAQWFIGGKLNIAWNTLDRHVSLSRPAIVAESEDGSTRTVSFAQLKSDVDNMAAHFQALGLEQGDRVALCMPMVPEVVTILYACFQLGLIVTPIFSGFGAGAIAARLENSGAKIAITAERLIRRGKPIPLRDKVQQAAGAVRVIDIGELMAPIPHGASRPLALDSETPAMLLYTSGTTGKPKGVVHTHAGALAKVAEEIYLAFDHQPDDRFYWLSDVGWMMGPWTIIGNHHFGGTIFLYDGAPDYPGPDRLWEMIERHGITTFGVSPTAIRMLMRTSSPDKLKMASLRLLGSTGEPWDESSYRWFFENIGKSRLPIINICGGTEIVGSFLFNLPIQPIKPCTVGAPAPGMATEVVDEAGHPVRGKMGHLVCTKPAPSMTRGVWGDPQRYLEAYWSRWPGYWNHGDWASVDEDGCWFVHGRADESMNVAGRKVGPAEIEEALIEHPAVSEAAVIGIPDEIKGEAIVAFVVLKPGAEVSSQELGTHVAHVMGSAFRPKAIETVRELPKTQSGKIVRRLIRQKYLGEPLGDLSTVENPAALDHFR